MFQVLKQMVMDLKYIKALSFLPPKHSIQGFEEIKAICNSDFQPILDYFEEYYIGKLF